MKSLATFLATLACLCVTFASVAQQRVLDDFASPDAWRIQLPEGVKLTLHADEGMKDAEGKPGKSLRLDYEFVTGGGYCVIARDLPMELPENYEFAFHVRGQGPDNNLEFKLVDQHDKAVGESVWWVNRRAFAWPSEWTRLSNKKRKLEFAWGPSGGAPLKAISRIEFAVASSSGGKGSVWLDDLTFRELPTLKAGMEGEAKAVKCEASSQLSGHEPSFAMDSDLKTHWSSTQGAVQSWLTFDFGSIREFGGVDVFADMVQPETKLSLEVSDDGINWTALGCSAGISRQNGFHALFVTPDAEARYVRLNLQDHFENPNEISSWSDGPYHNVNEVRFRDAAFSATSNSVVMALAKESPRGTYPKQFLNEATYWTVIGTPDSDEEALINEEGQIEVGKRMFSIEPFLRVDGKLLSSADCTEKITTELPNKQLAAMGAPPFPVVTRSFDSWTLINGANAITIDGMPWLMCGFSVTSRDPTVPQGAAELMLVIRPYQVNPPWQRLNFEGGVSKILSVETIPNVNALAAVRVKTESGSRDVMLIADDQSSGELIDADRPRPRVTMTPLPADSLAGLNGFSISISRLTAGNQRPQRWILMIPMVESIDEVSRKVEVWSKRDDASHEYCRDVMYHSMAQWQELLNRTQLNVPKADSWLSETFRAQLAYILINRDGPAIQPGSRSYERSWARDGSLTSAALMELGHQDEVREWIDWFGDHIFDNGKVPCVVDKRGADPVPEHDSHGQYIWAVANYYRYTKDKQFLAKHWPKVQHVVEYIQSLRAQRKTAEYADAPEGDLKRAMYGLVPESISHEGYSAKPMHSYWDCFFVALGLKEATYLAREAGDAAKAAAFELEYNDFQKCLLSSITLTQQKHGINYIPGCVELGDFDSTSTTISLFPCDEVVSTPRGLLEATFERYWQFFKDRRDGTGQFASKPWEAYTPYELRHVGAFVRLGWRERAYELLQWFRLHQRPQGWYHWAEVVWNDPKTPKFLGDMPHTWCGSDFLNSVLNMFAYTQETKDGTQLVCFAGIPKAWIDSGEAIELHGLRTQFGKLSLRMKREGKTVSATIEGEQLVVPPGGFLIRKPEGVSGDDVVVRTWPVDVEWKVE